MRLSRAVPAGVVDAGLASLATFVVNLYAIATWQVNDQTLLGIYFLYLAAFLLASTVPNQLLYIPAEKYTLDVPQPARVALFGRIARIGFPAGVVAALLVGLAAIVGTTQGRSLADQAPFLITAATATAFSPLQNHARRLLHLAGHSWAAASVSLVQVIAATAALVALVATPLASEWIPLGALALANITSVAAAAAILTGFSHRLGAATEEAVATTRGRIRYRELSPSGKWLVGTGMISTGNNLLVESAITIIAGAPAMALAGSAKTVAQPILVLSAGLRSVLGPPSMEAAKTRDRSRARRVARGFYTLTAAAVIGYTLLAGFDWVINPLARLVDQAYTVGFLVALSITANGINGAAFPGRLELIGASREKHLFGIEARANLIQLIVAVAVAAAAGSSAAGGSFARPVAFAALGLSRIFEYRRALNAHYGAGIAPVALETTISPSFDTSTE